MAQHPAAAMVQRGAAAPAFPLATVDPFLEGKIVQRVGSTTARLSKDALPPETTVMVLDYE
jgi:hypothetical protein